MVFEGGVNDGRVYLGFVRVRALRRLLFWGRIPDRKGSYGVNEAYDGVGLDIRFLVLVGHSFNY